MEGIISPFLLIILFLIAAMVVLHFKNPPVKPSSQSTDYRYEESLRVVDEDHEEEDLGDEEYTDEDLEDEDYDEEEELEEEKSTTNWLWFIPWIIGMILYWLF